jgi:hypothetical protein
MRFTIVVIGSLGEPTVVISATTNMEYCQYCSVLAVLSVPVALLVKAWWRMVQKWDGVGDGGGQGWPH